MTRGASQLRLTTNNFGRDDFLWNLFTDRFLTDDRRRLYTTSWDTDAKASDDWRRVSEFEKQVDAEHLFVNETLGRVEALMSIKDMLVYLSVRLQGGVTVTIGAEKGNADVSSVVDWLKKTYPRAKLDDPRSVRLKFWMRGARGATSVRRTISVPSWGEIIDNYGRETTLALSDVMNGFKPSHGGQLLLWHGLPGTGKTFALRALALHWRKWCKVECVIDPETFFGEADYMMAVLLNSSDSYDEEEPPTPTTESEDKEVVSKDDQWRLLILEDAGELLAEDARQRTGQGLSRMLNLADGLIGQGLQALILVTTNEPLKKMHDAVSRPGRCASEVEFSALTVEEAQEWLKKHELEDAHDLTNARLRTIAQLYGRFQDFSGARGARQEESLGFKTP